MTSLVLRNLRIKIGTGRGSRCLSDSEENVISYNEISIVAYEDEYLKDVDHLSFRISCEGRLNLRYYYVNFVESFLICLEVMSYWISDHFFMFFPMILSILFAWQYVFFG